MNAIITPGEKSNEEKIQSQKIVETVLDDSQRAVLYDLGNLYKSLTKDPLDIQTIEHSVNSLAKYNEDQEYKYLNNLLCPERNKGVKIPSPIPVPSCSFQLHNCVTLTTNSIGCLDVVLNPYFLAGSMCTQPDAISPDTTYQFLSTLWVNNSESLNGSIADDNFVPINLNQVIPNVYDQYRLVSASVVVKYIGRLDIVSGLIGGAIVFDENQYLGAYYTYTGSSGQEGGNTVNHDLAKYGNYDLAMDSFYHQENMSLEGIRLLYFPVDNSFEEYVRINDGSNIDVSIGRQVLKVNQDYYKSGFNFNIYTRSAPPNSACFQLDIYANFECLPSAQFLNYMPLSLNTGYVSPDKKKQAIVTVQKKPIMKAKEGGDQYSWKSAMKKMADKFGGKLPSIAKMVAQGFIDSVPLLKPTLGVAGSILEGAYNMLTD